MYRSSSNSRLEALNDLVPFLIKLRDFDNEDLPSADKFARLISTGLAGEPEGWAHKVLESGRGIILINGLDEAAENRRETVRIWLQDLLTQYPNARLHRDDAALCCEIRMAG